MDKNDAVEQAYKQGYSDAKKTGKWLVGYDGYYVYCSNCNNEPPAKIKTDFCPCCGAQMK